MPEDLLPVSCDVLVVGAGPAGSACAQALARAGLHTLLADQHAFPRDKVCGDALIPDTHAALKRLGVYDEVAALASPVPAVRCIGPRGGHVDVPGTMSTLPRKVLDQILVRAAERAGARLLPPLRFEAPLLEGGRVEGARLQAPGGGVRHDIRARWVVLATGAVPQALMAAGLCERHTPSSVALRGYYRHDGLGHSGRQLQFVWHPRLRGGYGWVFPSPGGLFNVGVIATGSHDSEGGKGRMRAPNLRAMFETFCEVHPAAAALVRHGQLQAEVKGAPLRCSLRGARWSRPGLLAAGEAAATTYTFSGEGIGKAMESGLMAAEALLQDGAGDDAQVQAHYASALRRLQPRFDLYDTADVVNRHPWLADLVVWRARRSPRFLSRLQRVLNETQSPTRLYSWRGISKLLLE